MTTIPTQLPAPSPTADSTARRGGLIAWGVVLIVIGAIAAVSVIAVLFTWLQQIEGSLGAQTPRGRRNAPRPPALRWTDFVGTLSLLAAAAGLVWTGIGSSLARRWSRPIIVIASFIVMAASTVLLVRFFVTLPAAMQAISEAQTSNRFNITAPGPYSVLLLYSIRAALIIVFGIIVPWLCFRFYLSPKTAQLLDHLDPRRTWTDRCPIPVLGWAAFCGLYALSLVLRMASPHLTAYTVILRGTPAIIGLAILAVLLLWGAWLSYRMDRLGWVLSFILMAAIYLATPIYLLTGGELADLGAAPVRAMPGSSADASRAGLLPPWEATLGSSLEAILVILIGLHVSRSFTTRYHATLLPQRQST